MKSKIVFVPILILFMACENGQILESKGKCGEGSKEITLKNNSNSKRQAFTVKRTLTAEKRTTSKTKVYKLSPGEEVSLGCNFIVNRIEETTVSEASGLDLVDSKPVIISVDTILNKFEIVGVSEFE